MMWRQLILVMLVLVSVMRAADEGPEFWYQRLSSADFAEREEASQRLWELGETALPVLDRALKGNDPELQIRAEIIRRKVLIGITADTPAEVSALLERYFDSGNEVKEQLLQQLNRMGAHDHILGLEQLEKDPIMRSYLREFIAALVPKMIEEALRAGRDARVRELLARGRDVNSYLRLGSYLDHQGELDQEIFRLRPMEDAESRRRYLTFLRVKGDLKLLRDEATRLGDQFHVALASVLLGDPAPFLRELARSDDMKPADLQYLKWTLARLKGDTQTARWCTDSMVGLATTGQPENWKNGLGNLYRMGLHRLAGELVAEKRDPRQMIEHLEITDQLTKIPEKFGVLPNEIPEDWLSVRQRQFALELESDLQRKTVHEEFFQVASFFQNRGHHTEAEKIFGAMFHAIRQSPKLSLTRWLKNQRITLSYWTASMADALGKEVMDGQIRLEQTVRIVFPYYRDIHASVWLLQQILDHEPDMPPAQVLRLIASFHGSLAMEKEVFDEWFERIKKKVRHEFVEERDDRDLRHFQVLLDRMARSFDRHELYLLRGEPAGLAWELKSEQAELFDRAMVALNVDDWNDARLCLEVIISKAPQHVESLFYALALSESGRKQEAVNAYDQALMIGQCAGQNSGQIFSAAASIQSNVVPHDQVFGLLQKGFLLTGESAEDLLQSARGLMDTVAKEALARRDWAVAAAFYELACWELYLYREARRGYDCELALNVRFKADFCRAMHLFEQGKTEQARELLIVAHNTVSGNGALADDFFPILREVGLTDLHDELCEISLSHAREVIEVFPQDANARNNFGWLASRANRCLDEAHRHMEVAVKLVPHSEAYLDTMAEVWFAKGDREKAVWWSEESRKFAAGDQQLREQNHRFKYGPFPVP